MCQIVYAPTKNKLILDDLKKSQENNPDGFGIAYAQNNRLFYCKKMADFNVFLEALKLVPENVPLIIHFRYTTHGETSKLNIHPFEVLNILSGDTMDVCMAHNGTVSSIHVAGEKKSDTHLYVEKILTPILKESPDLIFNPGFQLLVQRDIGSHTNKFIFLRGDGRVAWINKHLGHVPKEQPELWYSNEYSLKVSYRSSKNSNFTNADDRWRAHFPYYHGYTGSSAKEESKDKTVINAYDKTKSKEDTVVNLIHPNKAFFNMDEEEKDVPDEIKAYLKPNEYLLVNKFVNKVSLQGWGWVKYNQSSARWERHLSPLHKKWKITTCPQLRKEFGIVLPGDSVEKTEIEATIATGLASAERELQTEFEKKYDEKMFRILNENEILEWVMNYPDEASAWAAKNGFFGSQKRIAEFINDAKDGAEFVADFIYRSVRNLSNVKYLMDYEKKAG